MMMKLLYNHFLPCSLFVALTFCSSSAFLACHSAFSYARCPSLGIECRAAAAEVAPLIRGTINNARMPTRTTTTKTYRKHSASSIISQENQQWQHQEGETINHPLSSHKGSSCEEATATYTSPRTVVLKGFPDIVSVVTASMSAAILSISIAVSPAYADGATKEFKLPPINLADPNRCMLKSSAMGQANAARDSLYDLRQCTLSGSNAVGYDLSGVIMGNTDLSNANLQEAYFSKGYLRNSKFDGADFTNAIVDRANFKGSSLRGTIFKNTVLTGTSFEDADVENADFTDAYLGDFDIKNLCKNPTLKGENPTTMADTRLSVGCKNR